MPKPITRGSNVIKLDPKGLAIIDADVEIFAIASREQSKGGGKIVGLDFDLGSPRTVTLVEEIIAGYEAMTERAGCKSFVLMLTDKQNWRKEVLPTYKANRKKKERPPLLAELREAILTHPTLPVRQVQDLEGDDLCGIFQTKMQGSGSRTVIISIDKDMRTIPGWHFNPNKDTVPYKVSAGEAVYMHMTQTLTGDPVDHYKGCPGIGPKKAEKILRPAFGKSAELWKLVVDTYVKRGKTLEDALVQARVAYILQDDNWDRNKGIRLWTPPYETESRA